MTPSRQRLPSARRALSALFACLVVAGPFAAQACKPASSRQANSGRDSASSPTSSAPAADSGHSVAPTNADAATATNSPAAHAGPPTAGAEDAAAPAGAADAGAGAASPTTLFSRVGLIGASATAGFGVLVDDPTSDPSLLHGADMGDILIASCSEPILVSRLGSVFFYADPLATGRGAIDRMLRFKPSVIVGVDFLFWYGYGTMNAKGGTLRREEERFDLLEEGLRQADRIVALGVPVVLGDFPDMHDSIGRMLSPEQVPEPATLARLNERVLEWASTRPNVRILPLSTLVPLLDRGASIMLRGRIWSRGVDGGILQDDRLHPTLTGSMALATAACELAEQCSRDGACRTLEIDPDRTKERLLETRRRERLLRTASPPGADPP